MNLLLFTEMFSFLCHYHDFYRTWLRVANLFSCLFSFLCHYHDFYRTWLRVANLFSCLFSFLCHYHDFYRTWLCVANLFSCLLMLLCVFTFRVLWCHLRFQHTNDIRFVFTSSCLYEGPCLIYVMCVCLRLVVYNTLLCFCFVFLRLVYPIYAVSFNKIGWLVFNANICSIISSAISWPASENIQIPRCREG
jgi:hypothetical protein